MFRHSRVSTLWELKQLILSNLGAESDREIEVRHVGSSSEFRPFVPQTVPSPINVAPPDDVAKADYNSADDSDYNDESSCHSTRKTRTSRTLLLLEILD
ncbi:hypothetical protein PIB30_060640 [Stylosanthes scabra]|uniref:Uncharacterized protein n=1 Tax=Stylosanthes scabra TaxID=79078 RepID=A0ABU6RKR7_9FABA|nr:hypothetical protein [Stylosanthes scabra]